MDSAICKGAGWKAPDSKAARIRASEVMMEQVQQLFFDRGEKSFLSEIISIFRPISIHIDIRSETVITQFIWPEGKKVRLRFVGDIPGNLISVRTYVSYGRSYGECLYLCRKKIREETGQ